MRTGSGPLPGETGHPVAARQAPNGSCGMPRLFKTGNSERVERPGVASPVTTGFRRLQSSPAGKHHVQPKVGHHSSNAANSA